jgi:peptidoglycan/LPS O-acetylase OafA/YrhL
MDGGRKGGRILSIDALRCLAALAVLLLHVPHGAENWHFNAWLLLAIPIDFGYLGVTLFLVISGFCIHLAVARTMDHPGAVRLSWAAFWKRRFFRLYPPYVAAIVFSLVLYAWTNPEILHPECRITAPFWDIATHLLLVHNLFLRYGASLGNGAFWTLGLEEQLYAFYPIYLILRTRLPAMRALGYALGLTFAWRMWTAYSDSHHWMFGAPPFEFDKMGRWPFGYWMFWVLGAVAAESYTGAITLPVWCSSRRAGFLFWVAGVLTNARTLGRFVGSNWLAAKTGIDSWVQIAWPLTELSDVFFATFFFILLNRCVAGEKRGFQGVTNALVRVAVPIGVMSYSLYLVHVPVVQVFETAFQWMGFGYKPWQIGLRYVVMVPTALAVAWGFFMAVERWFIRHPKRAGKPADVKGAAGVPGADTLGPPVELVLRQGSNRE